MDTQPDSAHPDTADNRLMLEAFRRGKTADQTRREADYIEMLLNVAAPAHLLDVPCGGGRIALELAARRYRVTGVDLAAPLVEQAQRDARERGLGALVAAHRRDMRDLPWRDEFDGAYCFWESFGYFDDAGNLAFLGAVHAALKPGARFIFDTHVAETLLPHLQRRDWQALDGDLLALEEVEYDHEAGAFTRRWIFAGEGRSEHQSLTIRLYTYRELVVLVRAAGFATCEGYTWLSLIPFALGAPRLLLVAAKA